MSYSLEAKLSRQSKARKPSALREVAALYEALPRGSVINFGGGMPNANSYPFKSATFQINDGTEININSELMIAALQYGATDGYAPLVKILMDFQKRFHATPGNVLSTNSWGVLPVSGAMDGISKVFDMFLNEGDSYLLEVPVYPGVLSALEQYANCTAICCETDSRGLNPEAVRSNIEKALKQGLPSPKFLYTNPTANNPAGVSTTPDRRRDIYALACKYDFYIVEDDPYYFIRFDDAPIPSYLSFDTEGRVIRLDSFSKIFAAGIRLGFVTAPTLAIERLCLHLQVAQLHVSGIAQVMVTQLFNHWGFDNVIEHCLNVAALYHEQMQITVAAVQKHLKGVVEYAVPTGGFFLWLRVPCIPDMSSLIKKIIATKQVLLLPGSAFYPRLMSSSMANENYRQYIRVSFSMCSC